MRRAMQVLCSGTHANVVCMDIYVYSLSTTSLSVFSVAHWIHTTPFGIRGGISETKEKSE